MDIFWNRPFANYGEEKLKSICGNLLSCVCETEREREREREIQSLEEKSHRTLFHFPLHFILLLYLPGKAFIFVYISCNKLLMLHQNLG